MIRLVLPKPPSANNLFPTNRKTGRRYRSKEYETWIVSATAALWTQPWKRIKGPVHITITVEDSGRSDLANHEKAVVDFCVKHGLIEDDKRSIVRSILLEWGDAKGCVVDIEEAM